MQPTHLTPDSILHIYYLEGRISKDDILVNENYLGNWEEDNFSFLFFFQPAPEIIEKVIAARPDVKLIDTYEMTYEQWQGGKIEPRQIGSFLLTPPWFKPPKEEPSTILTIDPGVVFGNGLHPTTQDCLKAIEIACAGQKVDTMLDLGTGTGVLTVAALKLGCNKAVAVDLNYLAAQTAQKNMQYNGLQENVVVIQGQAVPFTTIPADLLVANIHYDVMKDLLQSEGFLQQKWFILSGLLPSDATRVKNTLASLPVLVLQQWHQSNWHTFLGITNN